MKEIIWLVVLSLISSILIFIGKNDLIFNEMKDMGFLNEEANIAKIQTWCFFLGIAWAGIWLPIKHGVLKKRNIKKQSVFLGLLGYYKLNLFKMVEDEIAAPNADLKTRIFIPQRGIKYYFNKYICNKYVLNLHHVEGISDSFHHDTLTFEINGDKVEGMVGKSFNDKILFIDLNLDDNNYNITDTQRTKIGNLEFCSTIPIFNKDQSEVRAIVSVDSVNKLRLNQGQKRKFEQHLTVYAAFIDKHIKL